MVRLRQKGGVLCQQANVVERGRYVGTFVPFFRFNFHFEDQPEPGGKEKSSRRDDSHLNHPPKRAVQARHDTGTELDHGDSFKRGKAVASEHCCFLYVVLFSHGNWAMCIQDGKRLIRHNVASSNLCSRCAVTYQRAPIRLYSAAATATAGSTTTSTSSSPPPPSTTVAAPSSTDYDIRSGLILTRAPLLTRPLHPFEDAFFFYQKRLEERLNTPFVTSVYFKPDTARRLDWDLKVKERQGTVAKELGAYHGKTSRAWDDELKVGDALSRQGSIVTSLLRDAEARVSDDAELIPEADVVPVEPPVARVSEADEKGDVRRLDRQMEKTLYLVVKGKDGWGFPADTIPVGENLHEVSSPSPKHILTHPDYKS